VSGGGGGGAAASDDGASSSSWSVRRTGRWPRTLRAALGDGAARGGSAGGGTGAALALSALGAVVWHLRRSKVDFEVGMPCSCNGMEWDGMGWNGVECAGMGWNGMEWNGMGWNGMEWDGMENKIYCNVHCPK